MKVKITATIDIDRAAWVELYDVHPDEFRKDVNQWAFHLLTAAAQDNGVTVEVH